MARETKVSTTRTGRTQLVATRLPFDLVARLDSIAQDLSLPGLTVTRSEATRAAITAGLPVVEKSSRAPAREQGRGRRKRSP
jgi:predicted transcriptional regulator